MFRKWLRFSLHLLLPNFFKYWSSQLIPSSLHLPISFSMSLLPVGFFFNTVRRNGFWLFQTYPVHCSLLFLIDSMMFGFWYSDSSFSFFLILHSLVTLSFTGPNIFLGFSSKKQGVCTHQFFGCYHWSYQSGVQLFF